MKSPRLNILVSASIASVPRQGGWTWAVLQFLLGLRRLGHEVWFIDPIEPGPIEEHGEWSPGAVYFREVMAEFDLRPRAALLLKGKEQAIGIPYGELLDLARKSDLLINISGTLSDRGLMLRARKRAYLDLDPAFTQLWSAAQGIDMNFAGHTHFVTIGMAIGARECKAPTCGLNWITTPQPIVLEHWPVAQEPMRYDGLTTVANWRGYGSVEYEGVFYGQKAHSLRQFMTLPTKTSEKFILAMAIHPDETKDLLALKENRWEIIEPAQVASTPRQFQSFVQSSKAEIGIAKSGYVLSSCGWFSDRSLCYLASGRPVIAQETGFSRYFQCGEGLLKFETEQDVLEAIDSLNRDYAKHAHAARALAEEVFDSDKVLSTLLEKLL